MEKIQVLKLNDGSIHETKQSAEKYLHNALYKGENLTVFEDLSRLNALQVRNYFIDNVSVLYRVLKHCSELNEVSELK